MSGSGMTALCGYMVIDSEGEQEPCNRPGTSWRWYQDVEHEDCLDVACDLHENEGGRRMHAAETECDWLATALQQQEAAYAALEQQYLALVDQYGALIDQVTAAITGGKA